MSLNVWQPYSRLRITSGVQRSATISDARAMGQYSRYDRTPAVSHPGDLLGTDCALEPGSLETHDGRSTQEVIMSDTDRGQVSAAAAEVYDSFFVPALFEQWTDVVLDAADVQPGHRVLDVGCGTGVLARTARARVGEDGHVAGLDPNDGMLAVARRSEPSVEWQTGSAEEMPFPDHSFDRTVSQFALMFFADPDAALSEMSRVTRPAGRVAIAVWDELSNNSGYARLATLVGELFGSAAADAIRAPFRLGDRDLLVGLADAAFSDAIVTRHARRRPIRVGPRDGSTPRSAAGRSPTPSTMTGSPRCSTLHNETWRTSSRTGRLPSTCPRSSSRRQQRRVGELGAAEVGVEPAGGDELVVGAALDDAAAVDDGDLVGGADRRQAVGDDDRRAVGERRGRARPGRRPPSRRRGAPWPRRGRRRRGP